MFKFIQILFFLISFFKINAQQTANNIVLRDVWGIERNLYQALDSGKTVILDFFITNCGTCQINTPRLDSIWNEYGHQGDSLWVWGIECSDRNDSTIIAFMQQFNASYPFFNTIQNDSIIQLYNITYTPQYFIVCPNKYIKQISIEQVRDAISGCHILTYPIQTINNEIQIKNRQITFPPNTNKWELFSVQGVMILQCNYKNEAISLNNLNNGIYFLKWYDKNKIYIQKLCLF